MTTFNERCVCGDELREHRTASLQCQKAWPNHWRADEPTVTLDELKSSAHELNDYSRARGFITADHSLLDEILRGPPE